MSLIFKIASLFSSGVILIIIFLFVSSNSEEAVESFIPTPTVSLAGKNLISVQSNSL